MNLPAAEDARVNAEAYVVSDCEPRPNWRDGKKAVLSVAFDGDRVHVVYLLSCLSFRPMSQPKLVSS